MRAKSFIKTSVNATETRINEDAWKKIVKQSVHLEEHCTKVKSTFDKEQQNFGEARCSIFEGFQLQNALIMFLFFHEKCLLNPYYPSVSLN